MICFRRLAAAQEAAAQQRSVRDCSPAPGHSMAPHAQQPPAGAKGPSSLFFLSEDNAIRRYTRFIIEWPYPLLRVCGAGHFFEKLTVAHLRILFLV